MGAGGAFLLAVRCWWASWNSVAPAHQRAARSDPGPWHDGGGNGARAAGLRPDPGNVQLARPCWRNRGLRPDHAAARRRLAGGAGGLITSAVGGEGKTSLASHLAVSLARSGRKTLLIDGDLRSPAVHRLFNVRRRPRLQRTAPRRGPRLRGPVPRGGGRVARADRAGVRPTGPVAVVPGRRGRTSSHSSRGRIDFIIVDSSPVLPVTDSLRSPGTWTASSCPSCRT